MSDDLPRAGQLKPALVNFRVGRAESKRDVVCG